MSILNISGTFGVFNLFKTWSADAARIDAGSKLAAAAESAEFTTRRTRTVIPAPAPHYVDRFAEEDCERWDGLS